MEDELTSAVNSILKTGWDLRVGEVIPKSEDITLGSAGVTLDATILYADLAGSTELALYDPEIASEVCKTYLVGTTGIIKAAGGAIRGFDGDRVMGIFIGNSKNSSAAKAATNASGGMPMRRRAVGPVTGPFHNSRNGTFTRRRLPSRSQSTSPAQGSSASRKIGEARSTNDYGRSGLLLARSSAFFGGGTDSSGLTTNCSTRM